MDTKKVSCLATLKMISSFHGIRRVNDWGEIWDYKYGRLRTLVTVTLSTELLDTFLFSFPPKQITQKKTSGLERWQLGTSYRMSVWWPQSPQMDGMALANPPHLAAFRIIHRGTSNKYSWTLLWASDKMCLPSSHCQGGFCSTWHNLSLPITGRLFLLGT